MAARAFADDTVYGAVSNFTKEGDAMDKFLGNHMSSLANTELYETASQIASTFNNSAVGITMPSL
ncbi:hypothetical protein I6G82_02425 [Lysinibacillus macroides]|nr:hypothetical protein [Lysinibacillus macroides]QPR68509.1 hypothetical protein I6G82_02425 [Lysinibacillus macroides]